MTNLFYFPHNGILAEGREVLLDELGRGEHRLPRLAGQSRLCPAQLPQYCVHLFTVQICIKIFFGPQNHWQCRGSGMFIRTFPFLMPDPGSKRFRIPDPHQRNYVFFTQKIVSTGSGSRFFLSIPDPGVKKAPDPQH
jgi:hypothetical protein